MKHTTLILLACGLATIALSSLRAAENVRRDIPYATVAGKPLLLDIHLPEKTPVGLLVWVHGGAWRSGSKANVDLVGLVARGWAIASMDYRLSPEAPFPAQIHDIKAAIRFLRAHAKEYAFPPTRFVITGSSAGGHLAALVGVTNGHAELEGTVGDFPRESSAVQAIVALYGASNLTTILAQSTPRGVAMREPALQLFLGGLPDAKPELARLASPVFHVDAGDPPLLLLHGDQDPQMPINQSHELDGAYQKLGLPVIFKAIHGYGHGGAGFKDDAALTLIDGFLRQHFRL